MVINGSKFYKAVNSAFPRFVKQSMYLSSSALMPSAIIAGALVTSKKLTAGIKNFRQKINPIGRVVGSGKYGFYNPTPAKLPFFMNAIRRKNKSY